MRTQSCFLLLAMHNYLKIKHAMFELSFANQSLWNTIDGIESWQRLVYFDRRCSKFLNHWLEQHKMNFTVTTAGIFDRFLFACILEFAFPMAWSPATAPSTWSLWRVNVHIHNISWCDRSANARDLAIEFRNGQGAWSVQDGVLELIKTYAYLYTNWMATEKMCGGSPSIWYWKQKMQQNTRY